MNKRDIPEVFFTATWLRIHGINTRKNKTVFGVIAVDLGNIRTYSRSPSLCFSQSQL